MRPQFLYPIRQRTGHRLYAVNGTDWGYRRADASDHCFGFSAGRWAHEYGGAYKSGAHGDPGTCWNSLRKMVSIYSATDYQTTCDLLHHPRSEEHTSELQSRGHLVCDRL